MLWLPTASGSAWGRRSGPQHRALGQQITAALMRCGGRALAAVGVGPRVGHAQQARAVVRQRKALVLKLLAVHALAAPVRRTPGSLCCLHELHGLWTLVQTRCQL